MQVLHDHAAHIANSIAMLYYILPPSTQIYYYNSWHGMRVSHLYYSSYSYSYPVNSPESPLLVSHKLATQSMHADANDSDVWDVTI